MITKKIAAISWLIFSLTAHAGIISCITGLSRFVVNKITPSDMVAIPYSFNGSGEGRTVMIPKAYAKDLIRQPMNALAKSRAIDRDLIPVRSGGKVVYFRYPTELETQVRDFNKFANDYEGELERIAQSISIVKGFGRAIPTPVDPRYDALVRELNEARKNDPSDLATIAPLKAEIFSITVKALQQSFTKSRKPTESEIAWLETASERYKATAARYKKPTN